MNNSAELIEEYRNAEANIRLDMFMLHRDLRDHFTQIDSEDDRLIQQLESQYVIRPYTANMHAVSLLVRIRYCCRSFVTNILNSFVAK